MHVDPAITGPGFECLVCGCSSQNVDKRIRRTRATSFFHAIRLVKHLQGIYHWDPKCPRTRLGRSLFRHVGSNLPLSHKRLRMYVSVGSDLDKMGVDLFFTYGDYGLVTVDLTVDPHKTRSRAYILLTADDFRSDRHYRIGDQIRERLWFTNCRGPLR